MKQSDGIITADTILAQIARLRDRSTPNPKVEAARRSYRHAAAVLAGIDHPKALRPVDFRLSADNPPDLLGSDLVVATGSRLEGRVILKHDVRRLALKELGSEGIVAALEANPKERTGVIQMQFERCLMGRAEPLEEQTREELEGTLQSVTWLEGIVSNLPTLESVRRHLIRREFSTVFETLAGDEVFRGRVEEMDRLRDFVGVLPPQRLLARVQRGFAWTRPAAQPALSVSGPGGVGKSALIARFVLEHSRLPRELKIPFAYLDLDRPALDVAEPLTLISEMLRQLTLQFSEYSQFQQLRDFLGDRTAEEQTSTEEEPNTPQALRQAQSILSDLLGTLEGLIGPRPYLVVLDTFERVQYRGETLAVPLWELLDQMQQRWPFLRVVISGRAPVTTLRLAGKPPFSLELGALDDDSALAFLRAQGITTNEIGEAIIRQVGGVPLSLKLAAAVLRSRTDSELDIQSRFWIRSADEVIQGQLYDRILGHIDDPEVASVAHPGLVLRRITPETILYILREPCKLAVRTIEDANLLFAKLRREASLVSDDDPEGALVHRRDLRAVMLRLIMEREPAVVADVNARAVAWYASQPGKRARAEEAYHRLLLEQPITEDFVADPDVRASLQVSITELPTRSQRLLATYGMRVDKEVLDKASAEERDSAIASQVEEFLPHPTMFQNALELLRGSGRRKSDSPLWRSWTRLYLELGSNKEALESLETGLRYASEGVNSDRIRQLLREKAWACERLERREDLLQTLAVLDEYVSRHNDTLGRVQHWMQSNRTGGVFEQGLLTDINARDVLRWLRRLGPREFFGIFPATRGFWSSALSIRSFHWPFVTTLILHDEAPFGSIAFQSEKAEQCLRAVIEAAYGRDDHPTRLSESLERLIEVWPYRNLELWPPESRRSLMTA